MTDTLESIIAEMRACAPLNDCNPRQQAEWADRLAALPKGSAPGDNDREVCHQEEQARLRKGSAVPVGELLKDERTPMTTEMVRAWITVLRGRFPNMMSPAEAFVAGWLAASPPQGSAVPDGWKLVPVEPTLEMLQSRDHLNPPLGPPEKLTNEYAAQWYAKRHRAMAEMWSAMLAASPPPASQWQPIATAPKDGTSVVLGWIEGEDGRERIIRAEAARFSKIGWHTLAGGHSLWNARLWMPLPPPALENDK